MASTDRGKRRCPDAWEPVRSADGKEVQQCIRGDWVTYDAGTLKEIRRKKHHRCDENGMIQD